MPQSGEVPPTQVETPAALRDMAARARRLAFSIADSRIERALLEFADELEARAARLEGPEVRAPEG